jgi:hypothetical protein
MREISRSPSRTELRLHCLDMAVNSARLLGRADNVTAVADAYFAWITQAPPASPVGETGDDAGPVGGNPAGGGAGGQSGPASLRQAGQTG